MTRASRVAVLGGSFDRLHVGHRALLDEAFRQADRVGVGITTDAFLRAHPKPLAGRIQPFSARRRAVERYLASRYPRPRWWTASLSDAWGRSIEPGVDVLVASEETARAARSVNRVRRRRGLAPIRVHLLPLVRGEDLLPVSARRIRAGLIDPQGRRRRPISIVLLGGRREDAAALRTSLRAAFGAIPIVLRSRRIGRSSRSALRDPRQRAIHLSLEAATLGEYGVGASAGASDSPRPGERGWIALADAEGLTGATPANPPGTFSKRFARIVSARRSTSSRRAVPRPR
ncbi:MAG TPA: pantetheine-phosphate adenylyltransferase [Thermoplasmata archaeon]